MCPPVSSHKGASVVHPPHNACVFGMETPLRGRSGGHAGTAPTVSFGQITHGWLVSFLLKIIMKFMANNFALIKNILIFGESKEAFSAA